MSSRRVQIWFQNVSEISTFDSSTKPLSSSDGNLKNVPEIENQLTLLHQIISPIHHWTTQPLCYLSKMNDLGICPRPLRLQLESTLPTIFLDHLPFDQVQPLHQRMGLLLERRMKIFI